MNEAQKIIYNQIEDQKRLAIDPPFMPKNLSEIFEEFDKRFAELETEYHRHHSQLGDIVLEGLKESHKGIKHFFRTQIEALLKEIVPEKENPKEEDLTWNGCVNEIQSRIDNLKL